MTAVNEVQEALALAVVRATVTVNCNAEDQERIAQAAWDAVSPFIDTEERLIGAVVTALRSVAQELEVQGVEPWNRNSIAIQTLRFHANQIENGI